MNYLPALNNIIGDIDKLTADMYANGQKKESERLRELAAELYWLYHEWNG